MDNRIYGYARVSSREQNEDRQLEALKSFGVPEGNIIIDKASGKDIERVGYQYMKQQILRKRDTLVIKELDRLHIMDCIECGSCSFTCPGKLPLVEKFRKGKKELREANLK